MATGRPKRTTCRVCGKHTSEVGELSARGLCDNDGTGNAIRQQTQMSEHDGPYFQQWRRAMARSIGAILPEDVSNDRSST